MQIAVFSTQSHDKRFMDEARPPTAQLVYLEPALSLLTAPLAAGCEAVCVFVNDALDAPVLRALHGLGVRAILLRCAGFNQLDAAEAARLGFFVARVPAAASEAVAVAEHTLALVLTLNRHTHRAHARVRDGNFALDGLLGMNLHGKTVGILGTGKIGVAAARIFKGFGCRLLAQDPSPCVEFSSLGKYTTLPVLLRESDILTLHCPLNDSTRYIINLQTLALMKPGAMLVNTSRGALLDTQAVIASLKSRRLGALAIDVYEQESALFFSDRSNDVIDDDIFQRLLTFPNVLVTGHQGFFTIEAMREIAAVTFANLSAFEDNSACPNLVLPPA